MIIGATGKAGSGKDELLNGMTTELELNYTFRKYGFADPIKRGLEAMFGWTPECWEDRDWKEREIPQLGRMISPRYLAQTLGTEWGRGIHHDIWVKLAQQAYTEFDNQFGLSDKIFLLPDVRFKNEAAWIRAFGGTLIEVVRGSPEIEESEHASEQGVPDKYITHSIVNDGTIDELIVKGIMLCGL